jgi:hypothetical protein
MWCDIVKEYYRNDERKRRNHEINKFVIKNANDPYNGNWKLKEMWKSSEVWVISDLFKFMTHEDCKIEKLKNWKIREKMDFQQFIKNYFFL